MAIQRRGLLWESTVEIGTAALRMLHTTPVLVAPAPGVGRVIVPTQGVLVWTPTLYGLSAPDDTDYVAYLTLGGGLQLGSKTMGYGFSSDVRTYGTWIFYDQGNRPTAAQINTALYLSTDLNLTGNYLTAIAINNGGLGYAVGNTGTVGPIGTGFAEYRVVAIGALGVVTSVTLNYGAGGYTSSSNVATVTQTGAGSGLTVDTTATPGTGTLRSVLTYATPRMT